MYPEAAAGNLHRFILVCKLGSMSSALTMACHSFHLPVHLTTSSTLITIQDTEAWSCYDTLACYKVLKLCSQSPHHVQLLCARHLQNNFPVLWNLSLVTTVINKFNPLNPELNPICYLLALLGAHHFLHVSRIRVKSLTFRRLMSYIWSTHSWCF